MGWFFVNIIVPVAAPLLGVLFLGAITPPTPPGAALVSFSPMMMVKDGQLGWIATGMCSAAFYDLIEMIDAYNLYSRPLPSSWHAVILPLLLCLIGSVFVAALGAVYSTSIPAAPPTTIRNWTRHYKNFVSSVIVTISSAITFALIHFSLLPRSLGYIFPTGGQ